MPPRGGRTFWLRRSSALNTPLCRSIDPTAEARTGTFQLPRVDAAAGSARAHRSGAARSQEKNSTSRQAERLGQPRQARPAGPLGWVHAASVGELHRGSSRDRPLQAARPDVNVLVTTGTVTSARIAAKRLGPKSIHQFVPIDTPQAVNAFLDHWRPSLAVFTESDIWPNLVMAASDAAHSARARQRAHVEPQCPSVRRRKRIAKQPFRAIPARPGAECGSCATLRAAWRAQGNQCRQFEILTRRHHPVDAIELARLRRLVPDGPSWSRRATHDGEESIIAEVHAKLRETVPDVLTILAPRHPERGAALAAELAAPLVFVWLSGPPVPKPGPDTDILLADTIGELGLFYSLGRLVFLGGSLVAARRAKSDRGDPARLRRYEWT